MSVPKGLAQVQAILVVVRALTVCPMCRSCPRQGSISPLSMPLCKAYNSSSLSKELLCSRLLPRHNGVLWCLLVKVPLVAAISRAFMHRNGRYGEAVSTSARWLEEKSSASSPSVGQAAGYSVFSRKCSAVAVGECRGIVRESKEDTQMVFEVSRDELQHKRFQVGSNVYEYDIAGEFDKLKKTQARHTIVSYGGQLCIRCQPRRCSPPKKISIPSWALCFENSPRQLRIPVGHEAVT